MVRLLRHRQTKGPVSARPHLNRRATPRLHLIDPSVNDMWIYRPVSSCRFVLLGFARIVVRDLRRQLPDDKFLKQIGDGSFANPNRRVFER